MGIIVNDGDSKPVNLTNYSVFMNKAKNFEVAKHGNHDQASHGAWANGKYNPDDSEGEDSSEPKNYKDKKPKISYDDNDTEGEFDNNADDPRWMDDMDILRPPKRK